MKIFVASKTGNGLRKTDIWQNIQEGEWVMPSERNYRHLVGIVHAGITTTFRVIDLPMQPGTYIGVVVGRLMAGFQKVHPTANIAGRAEVFEEFAMAWLELANCFDENELLERQGDDSEHFVRVRRQLDYRERASK